MDGVESEAEAHNVERPARKALKRKPKGKDLSEFEIGAMITGTIKSVTNYGAFVDIGASTDGLLHISQLAAGYVASVADVVAVGDEVEVRLISIDSAKGQVALSMMSEEDEAAGKKAAGARGDRPQRQQGGRRDDSAVLAALDEKGWDPATFIEGTVASTVDFGCFVRLDASLLNSECEGQLDGLVHISALRTARVNSVTDVVSVNDKVQVRVKSITGNKVSLTMLSVEEEDTKSEERGGGGGDGGRSGDMGAKDWKELVVKFDAVQPAFTNTAVVEDRRK
jgi:predicted RNA-binding protein with RPS1 domain